VSASRPRVGFGARKRESCFDDGLRAPQGRQPRRFAHVRGAQGHLQSGAVAHRSADRRGRLDLVAAVGGVAAVAGLAAWFAGWTSPGRGSAAAEAAWVLLTSGPYAVAWIVAAVGFGWPLRRAILPASPDALSAQVGLGVAAMLLLDAALGAAGALQWAGSAGAWALLLAGAALAAAQAGALRRAGKNVRLYLPPWPAWLGAPAVAVLLLAACSAPGWLWASEFGGYDAMSYHLQLPAEWLKAGRIRGLEHNVYSYLPGYMEAAYYHLAILAGGALDAAYACQLLHASLALLAAVIAGRLAARIVEPPSGATGSSGAACGAAAAIVLLGTPWVVVVGSLAYNEMAVALLLSAVMAVTIAENPAGPSAQPAPNAIRLGACTGVLSGCACGAKLTAAGFVALPAILLLLARLPRRRWAAASAAAALAGAASLAPYLARNAIDAGNPVFPLATGLLGRAHWSAGQVQSFLDAHRGPGLPAALVDAWNQSWRYGLGSSRDPEEPWVPQWSLLPWLAAAGAAAGCASARLRPAALRLAGVLAAQGAFWVLFTHVRSRFIVPAAVPAAAVCALGAAALAQRVGSVGTGRALAAAAALGAVAWAAVPAYVYAHEPFSNRRAGERVNGTAAPRDAPSDRIGWADLLSGAALRPQERQQQVGLWPAVMLNYGLPEGSRVLLVGDATPLYYDRTSLAYQTVWDRGPLRRAIEQEQSPPRWFDRLRDEGFTHLLIDQTMLRNWQERGWGDPLIDTDTLLLAASAHADLLAEYPAGVRLYRLRPAGRDSEPGPAGRGHTGGRRPPARR
jgi:hypothetical protein